MSVRSSSPVSTPHAARIGGSNAEASEIHAEMRALAAKQRELEQRRRALQALPPSSDNASQNAGNMSRSHSQSRLHKPPSTAGTARSHSFTRANSYTSTKTQDPPGATNTEDIKTEAQRRAELAKNEYRQMKEAMRQAHARDTSLLSGFFLQKESSHGSWGRAPRFSNPTGQKGAYYLSNDIQRMQGQDLRFDRRRFQVGTRGHPGANVQNGWNNSRGGGAPGPGAYTPRYSAASSFRDPSTSSTSMTRISGGGMPSTTTAVGGGTHTYTTTTTTTSRGAVASS